MEDITSITIEALHMTIDYQQKRIQKLQKQILALAEI
tara:strand:+ start:1553 stop:1663 length:111 start_codon:yes stop_codon:yes gene_type:complete